MLPSWTHHRIGATGYGMKKSDVKLKIWSKKMEVKIISLLKKVRKYLLK
jgi:hypothetical protein